MQQILVPPSPNWYGAHTADWAAELGLYAYAAQNTVVMLNSRAQSVRTMLSGHAGRVTAVAFAGAAVSGHAAAGSADQPESLPLLVSASADRSLRLWNLSTMQRLRALYKRPAEVTALAASNDGGTALIGDKQGALWAWDLTDPASKPVKLARCKHTAAVACLAATPPHSTAGSGSSLVLAGYLDGSVALLDWRQDRPVQRLERHAQEVQCVRWAAAPDPTAAAAVAAAREALSREKAAAAAQEAEAAAAAAAAAAAPDFPGGEGSGSEPTGELAAGETASTAAEAEQPAAAQVPPRPPGDFAAADPVAAAAAALQAAQQALAAAPPAWEVLLSSGADGALRLYSFPSRSASSTPNAGSQAPQLQLLTTLRLPRPPPGLPTGQSNRLWFSAAVVPPLLPQPTKELATGGEAPAGTAAEGSQPIWLVSSAHAGSLLAWKVALPSGAATASAAAEAAAAAEARAAAFGRRGPAAGPPQPTIPAVQPNRLPISHGRTVFTVHAAPALLPKPTTPEGPVTAAAAAAAAAAPAAEDGSPTKVADPLPQQQQPQAEEEMEMQPVLQLFTTSMDRSVYMSQLPHPGAAAAAAVQGAAPEGSWRRDAVVGAATSAAWHKLTLTWKLTGLGGHAYSLSLLDPLPAGAKAPLLPVDQPVAEPLPRSPEQQQQQQQQPKLEGGGAEDAVPPPPPPPGPVDSAVDELSQSGLEPLPPPPPPVEAPAEAPANAGSAAQPEQQPEQQPGAAAVPQHVAPDQQAQPEQQEPLLLALGCGDRTIRVQPVPAPGTPHNPQQTAQLLLWQNIPDRVTAVAWQPALPASSGAAPASRHAAAAAGLAFGCGDGSLGLMVPSQERSMLLPVKHKGTVADLCWTPAPALSPDAGEQPAALLYSLSADGTLLLWGPLPLPLISLISSSKAAASSTGGSAGSWSAPAGRPAAPALVNPLDLCMHLAAAAAAAADGGAGAGWLASQQQPSITAFAVLQPGSPAADAAGGTSLLAVALVGGGLAVLTVGAAATTSSEPALRLLWASGGAAGAATHSHICFSADGWQLAAATESGTVSVHPWAAEAGLLPADAAAAAPLAAAAASVQLDSAVTALAWTPASSVSDTDSGSASGIGGDCEQPGCGSGGILAAALVLAGPQASGGIQLLDLRASGYGGSGSSQGRLVPTALLRGHSAPVRCLKFLPPEEQPAQQASSEAAALLSGSSVSGQQEQAQLEQQPGPQALQPQPPRRFLLTGSEDQSVRLYDIQRQLAAWQQRQAAAAPAAAAEVDAAASAMPAAVAAAAPAPPVAAAKVASVEQAQAAASELAATDGEGSLPQAPQQQEAAAASSGPAPVAVPASTDVAAAPPASPAANTPAPAQAIMTPDAPAAAAPAAAWAGPTPAAAPATAAAAGSKKKAALSSLGARPILPTAEVVGSNLRQLQAAQQACLQLAEQLAQEQALAASAKLGGASPALPAPSAHAAAALLDCAAEPLTASLALHQAATDLGAGAAIAQSAASRVALAQRAAVLALFRGDVGAAMQQLLEHDALTADFVSLSAAAGPAAWRAVTLAWAAKLEQQLGEPHLAALHLLAVQEVEAAVQVYRRAGLIREALALAAARLLPGQPLLSELHASYAAQLAGQGQHERAAAHHLAAGRWAAAAAVLLASGSASGAAAAARVCQQALGSRNLLPEAEQARVQQQLEQAELALSARVAAEGTTVEAVLAELEPPQPAVVVADAAEATTSGADTSATQAGRQRYSAQQLLAVGRQAAGSSSPLGLPEDLAASIATATTQSSAIPNETAVFGRTGTSRQRYSLQTMLEIDADAEAAPETRASARQALPADLLRQEDHDA